MVLILDDFTNWTAGNRRFPSMLQTLVQRADPKSPLLVLLCKPAVLYEKERAKEASAFLLTPFSFFEMRKLYPNMDAGRATFTLLYYRRCSGLLNILQTALYRKKSENYFSEPMVFFIALQKPAQENIILPLPLCGQSWHLLETAPESFRKFATASSLPAQPEACSLLWASRNLVSRIVPVTGKPGQPKSALFDLRPCFPLLVYLCTALSVRDRNGGRGQNF